MPRIGPAPRPSVRPVKNLSDEIEWRATDEGLKPFFTRRNISIAWAPQPGSQEIFLACPIRECLYEGTRGPGKTDALLMDFARDVGRGLGPDWRGVLFRRSYKELGDVIEKAKKWFPRIFPGVVYNETDHFCRFPAGETLLFRHFERDSDYNSYHGHAYPWIGWEEICNWPSDVPFTSMISTNRSANPRVRKRIRSTANPYGVGHNWVKLRYRLPISMGARVGPIIKDALDREGKPTHWRVAVHGDLSENLVLLHADPNYEQTIGAAAKNESQLRAWKRGDWNVVAGGMFDDVWDPARHVVPDFPLSKIPAGWYVDRSYDHGQSKPFSVGWWAESNGEPFTWNGRTYGHKRGDLYRVAEWYGWNGRPNEGLHMTAGAIAKGILQREASWEITGRVKPGPADTQIFDASELRDEGDPVRSVATDMEKAGVKWKPADKGPGSRKQGWQQLRKALLNAINPQREEPGVFVAERCVDGFIRTIPGLSRGDKDLDDVDDQAEAHVGDEVRYRLRAWRPAKASGWV
jgi:hypothetical protein